MLSAENMSADGSIDVDDPSISVIEQRKRIIRRSFNDLGEEMLPEAYFY